MKDRCPTCGSFNKELRLPLESELCPLTAKITGIVICKDQWHDQKEKPMNEWKELKIDNLPPDILSGEYEFQWLKRDGEWDTHVGVNGTETKFRWAIFRNINDGDKYRYRRKEKPVPSHEERITKWWFDSQLNGGQWCKVVGYANGLYLIMEDVDSSTYRSPKWFNGRKSADIPPEE